MEPEEEQKSNSKSLLEEIQRLKLENAKLKKYIEDNLPERKFNPIITNPNCCTADVPIELQQAYKKVEIEVAKYFTDRLWQPSEAKINFQNERYILIRCSSLTVQLFKLIAKLLNDEKQALEFVRNLLFDLAHSIGLHDASIMIENLGIRDPYELICAGPATSAFLGWLKYHLSDEIDVTVDPSKFHFVFDTTNSFEAMSYISAGIHMDIPICGMAAGYTSGFNEGAFKIRLIGQEVLCKARGDSTCRFIIAHPDKIRYFVSEYKKKHPELKTLYVDQDTPSFFERRTRLETMLQTERNQAIQALYTLQHQHRLVEIERKIVVEVLNNVFPRKIAKAMARGERIFAERQEATIIFADIVGFTETSSQLSPERVIAWLEKVFSVLDTLSEELRVEKIKTIGDSYMCAAGIPDPQENHVELGAKFALKAMVRVAKIKHPITNKPMRMRIGINTGPVVSGILKGKKFMFDVWGDTVNVAQRMESTAEPGKIHVTEAVAKALKHKYEFQEKQLSVKGIGFLKTYYLIGEKQS